MEMAGVLRSSHAGELQPRVVGLETAVSRRGTSHTARRRVLRSRRQVSRAGQYALRALFPRADSPIPVPPRARPDGRVHRTASPLLDLWKQGSRSEVEGDARNGRVETLA